MAAGFGGGGGAKFAPTTPGDYTFQVVDVQATTTQDYNDKSVQRAQFKWTCDLWTGQGWERRNLWTGRNFTDISQIQDPKFISKLNYLVRACGLPVPTDAAQAAAWNEQSLIGRRFTIRVEPDPASGILVQRWLPPASSSAPQQQAPPAAAPPVAPQQYVPPAPALQQQAPPAVPQYPPQQYAPPPPAPQYLPPAAPAPPSYPPSPPVPNDPFAGDPGATPPRAAAALADPWA